MLRAERWAIRESVVWRCSEMRKLDGDNTSIIFFEVSQRVPSSSCWVPKSPKMKTANVLVHKCPPLGPIFFRVTSHLPSVPQEWKWSLGILSVLFPSENFLHIPCILPIKSKRCWVSLLSREAAHCFFCLHLPTFFPARYQYRTRCWLQRKPTVLQWKCLLLLSSGK